MLRSLPNRIALVTWALVVAVVLGLAGARPAQGGMSYPLRLGTGPEWLEITAPEEVDVGPDEVFQGFYFRVLQFRELPTYEMRQKWAQEGLHLLDYIPENSYFAAIETDFDLSQLAPKVITIAPAPEALRLEPAVRMLLHAPPATRASGVHHLTIGYYAVLSSREILQDLTALGVQIEAHRPYSQQMDIVVSDGQLQKVLQRPYVQYAGFAITHQPVYLEGFSAEDVTPEGYEGPASGRANYLNSGYLGTVYRGDGIVVAPGEGGTVDPQKAEDFQGRFTEFGTGSVSGHKTGVAIRMAGGGNLDPLWRGIAWGATVLSLPTYPDYAARITNEGARYFNHSYGWGVDGGYNSIARDHDARIHTYPKHLVVYSAGNDGGSTGYPPYDSLTGGWGTITGAAKHNKNHLAVAALSELDALTGFSSRGPAQDGRIIPQIAIQGRNGTSYAAPRVTGLLALLNDVFQDRQGSEPDAILLRAILLATADDVDLPGIDFRTGFGRPNARRAYRVIDEGWFQGGSLTNTNDTWTYPLNVPANTAQLRVMLMWPDPPAAVNANPVMVNDLDLTVTAPDATVYQPWVLDHTPNEANLTAPATRQADHLNTMELVTVDNPAAGPWMVNVTGHSIPQGPQSFYIVYEFVPNELHITFPLKDVRFDEAQTYILKWDSYGGSDPFTLEYQLDGGAWQTIATNVPADVRNYAWTTPTLNTGVHTLKVRVRQGSATSESDVNYLGGRPSNLQVDWVCGDAVHLSWSAASGDDGYRVYTMGAKYMEEITANITFDGPSALITGVPGGRQIFAVSGYTGAHESLRTAAVIKTDADEARCPYLETRPTSQVNKQTVTLQGAASSHGHTLADVRFEYGDTAALGNTTSTLPVSASGPLLEPVSATIASSLHARSDVLYYRLTGTVDGASVQGDIHQARLAPGQMLYFSASSGSPRRLYSDPGRYQVLGNAPRTIAFWFRAYTGSLGLFQDGDTARPNGVLTLYNSNSDTWHVIAGNATFDINLTYSRVYWHHLAFTYDGATLRVYYDGALIHTETGVTLDTPVAPLTFGHGNGQDFSGFMDEISYWDVALTQDQIRDLMHHPLQGDETGLRLYYHFDDPDHLAINVVDGRVQHLENATNYNSSAPHGYGATVRVAEAGGVVDASAAGVQMNFTTAGTADLVVSRIDIDPANVSGIPSGLVQLNEQYWVIHRIDGNGAFAVDITFQVAEDLTELDAAKPERLRLYARNKGSYASYAWQQVATASQVDPATNQVTFSNLTELDKQFLVVRDPSIEPTVDVSITKRASPDPVLVGQTLTYTLAVSNAGPDTASDVTVTDTLPADVTYQSDTCGGSVSGGTWTWHLGLLTNGASATCDVTVQVALTATDPLTNTASVSTTANDADTTNNQVTLTTAVQRAVDLELGLTAHPSGVATGDSITFSLTLTNQGPLDATGVQVTALFPSGFAYTAHHAGQGTYDPATGVWDVGALPAGATATLEVSATAQDGDHTFRAEVTACDQPDRDSTPGDGTGDDYAEVTPTYNAQVDLELSLTASATDLHFGDAVTFTLTLRNAPPASDATGVQVTALLPSGFAYTAHHAGQGTYDPATGVWDVGALPAGATATLEVSATAQDGDHTFQAEVTACDQPDRDSTPGDGTGDDYAEVTPTYNAQVDLELSLEVTPSSPGVQEDVTFTLTVRNAPTGGPATGVKVRGFWDNGYQYQSHSASQGTVTITFASTHVDWDVGTLAPGAQATLTLRARVLPSPARWDAWAEVYAVDQTDLDSTPGDHRGDDHFQLRLTPQMPATGFAPGRTTMLPPRPANLPYANTDLILEIPRLEVHAPIVGVPSGSSEIIAYLDAAVGYLVRTAFPTWPGNSVLTAHNYLPNGTPGPFWGLKQLRWGDVIRIVFQGQVYEYEVRRVVWVAPTARWPMRPIEDGYAWLTLITCDGYDTETQTYSRRVVVQAVLMRVYPAR